MPENSTGGGFGKTPARAPITKEQREAYLNSLRKPKSDAPEPEAAPPVPSHHVFISPADAHVGSTPVIVDAQAPDAQEGEKH